MGDEQVAAEEVADGWGARVRCVCGERDGSTRGRAPPFLLGAPEKSSNSGPPTDCGVTAVQFCSTVARSSSGVAECVPCPTVMMRMDG